jgi:Ca2+-binding EF-hand superfamily protein
LLELLNHDLKDSDTCHTGDAFAKKDTENLTGLIRLEDFKKIIRKTIFLTPKEKNLIIREIKTPTVNYLKFHDIIYEARY